MARQVTAPKTSCFTCQGRAESEWCVLTDDEVGELNTAKTCNTYRPGQVIFYEGNQCLGLYCIEAGTVAIRRSDAHGHSILVRLATSGQTLGYRTFFAGGNYTATAEALTEAKICFVDRSAVSRLLETQPMLGLSFIQRMASELGQSEEARLQMMSLPVRARLAHLLLALKDRYARALDDGSIEIDLPLARQDIASMIGARPETIARAIKDLETEGVAQFKGRHVHVPDLDDLLDEIEMLEAV